MHLGFNSIFVLTLVLFASFSSGAKILFYFTGGTYSHDIAIWPLAVHLADRNHSVTYFSAHTKKPTKDPRIRVISPTKIEEINGKYLGDVLQMRLDKLERKMWTMVPAWSYDICEYIMTDTEKPDTRAIFHKDKFDLIILDAVLCDCGFIAGYFHNAKVIVSDSTSVLPWFHHVFGFPEESTWMPATSMFFNYPMSLMNVIQNFFEPWYWTYARRTEMYPKLDRLIKNVMKDENAPSFLETERRTDFVFVNTHPAVELPRSLPPNVIPIGGMHIWDYKNGTLPEDIKAFLEEPGKDGAIMLAFGSNIDFSSIPKHLEPAFFEAIKRFPKINFIAKGSGKWQPHFPKNLRLEKWLPQKEIMAHPKTLACITHAGLNGILEATFFGIPLVVIPIFAEQDFQAYKLEAREVGIKLELRDLTADLLATAINNITTNPKYRNNMKKLQAAFKDRPVAPLDLATFYIEYALRHDDLSFMKPITYQPWRKYLEDMLISPRMLAAAGITTLMTITSSVWFLMKS